MVCSIDYMSIREKEKCSTIEDWLTKANKTNSHH